MKSQANGKKSLLLVEDELDLRLAVRDILSNMELEVVEASNGLEALQYLKNNPVNVVLTDIRMPQMDGMEFVGRLRQDHPDTPVIFFSGFADKEVTIRALRLGAVDMIEKPAKKEELLSAVRRAIQKDDAFVESKLQLLNLNSTQTKILAMVLKGMGNKEIAAEIKLSEQGVKYHVGNLFKRFDTTNRFELKEKILTLLGPKSA